MTPNPHRILTHARAGNPVRAWRLFGELGLGEVTDDIKVLTLKGRLLKDLAWRVEGDEAKRLFREASKAYLAAYALKTDSYPLINAAALALFAGDEARSRALAQDVRDLVDTDPGEGETPYWREATRAEAQLLLGSPAEAEASLAAGIDALPEAWEDHARTIEQFTAIISAQGGDATWLDRHRPPCSIHFSGMIGLDPDAPGLREGIDTTIARLRPGFAFGALAAGADILIAEAAVAAGARLTVSLPSTVEEFRATSVAPYGSDWNARFDRLIERAERVEALSLTGEKGEVPFGLSVETANLVSMGQALRNADILSSHAHAITIAAPDEEERLHVAHWLGSGRPLHRIETPRAIQGGGLRIRRPEPNTALGLRAIVAFRDLGQNDAARLAQKHGLQPISIDGVAGYMGEPNAGIVAMLDAARRGLAQAGSLLIDILAKPRPDGLILDRVSRLSRAVSAGESVTDGRSAMIARVLSDDIHIEELGELPSLSGPISLWAIHP